MTGTATAPSPAPPSHTRNRATGLAALHWLTGLSAHFLKRPLKCLHGGRCVDLVSRPAGLFCSFGSREGVSRSFVLCSATFGQTLFLSKWQKKRKKKKGAGRTGSSVRCPRRGSEFGVSQGQVALVPAHTRLRRGSVDHAMCPRLPVGLSARSLLGFVTQCRHNKNKRTNGLINLI